MTIDDVQQQAWQAIQQDVPYNPDAGFVKEWLGRKAGWTGPVGMPVTGEIALDDGSVAQVFSGGFVLHWGPNGAEVL